MCISICEMMCAYISGDEEVRVTQQGLRHGHQMQQQHGVLEIVRNLGDQTQLIKDKQCKQTAEQLVSQATISTERETNAIPFLE